MDTKLDLSSSRTMLALIRTNSVFTGISFIVVKKKHIKIAKIILVMSFLINVIYSFNYFIHHKNSFKNEKKIMYYYTPLFYAFMYSIILIALIVIY